MATFKKLEDIIAWQKARIFCHELKKIFPLFIAKKEFELLNQLKNSSGSAMDNIAEGFGRMGTGEFKNFVTISHGSILESISQLHRSFDWEIISKERFDYYRELAEEIERLTFPLANHLIQTDHKGYKFR